MTTKHPFGESSQKLEASLERSQIQQNSPSNNSTLPVTTLALGEEGGATTEAFDNLESGGNFIATTLAIGEEGGFSEAIPTTVATEEEGGNSPVPTTATLGAEAGITPIPLPPGVVTTLAVGEEGGDFPEATTLAVGEEGGDFPEATTLAVGEAGDMGFQPTTRAVGEDGATTEALGEEGGFATLTDDGILTQPGTEEGIVTTLAIGEEGGATTLAIGEEGGIATFFDDEILTQPGSEAGVVTTQALGEEGGNFNEEIYRQSYPSINVAINRGELNSGLEHYVQFGQFEIQRIGFFTGTNGNDIITAFGNNTRIVGVNTLGYNPVNDEIIPNSFGVGEVDILVGSSRAEIIDQFILGSSQGLPFYLGFGNLDFALIKNFDVAFDQIQLPGSLDDYSVEIINNSVNISTQSGDLIGIIEDVPSLDNLRINFI
ncbi:hypothetical protein [Hydrocoleum sp. CS-953]|uniref:hypothetical protein n=1 Tax=Hydrocoleum sp. CS-953 TaxID=1671698 RepID=UPI000B9BDDBC|nr:hypothetical protein [Hydrocoleum sp. CS-953]